MHIMIGKEDLEKAEEFVQSGELVDLMDDWGLSIRSMSIILNLLFEGFDNLKKSFEESEKNNDKI